MARQACLIGGKEGSWAAANLGVIVALSIGLAGSLMFQRGKNIKMLSQNMMLICSYMQTIMKKMEIH